MDQRWLFRAAKWARNPPSAKRVKLVFAVVAICLVLVAIEKLFGMPEWMQIERLRFRP
ncbi:hypothetical protein K3556_08410 [Aliiroseovarius sp. M344]|uniref:hypothetical protein n=1 Tax=Aliiroseovarius sp. M344 TaxID=2867010 RepID=UPI0021AD7F4D|nr:hypothetical protein [Aliiroseovarius sp. M344]UWQ12999.1 hypothetical protein K3556_08410 [Aliiroseovarius sp. M344]